MGIYSNLEDKWYDLLDALNAKIPVYKIIDPIDKVVPSFILFILLFFIIILLIIFSVSNFSNRINSEVIVVSLNNTPLSSVRLLVETGCGEELEEYYTNEVGKANIKICINEFVVTAEKNGYQRKNQIFYLGKDNVIQLSPIIATASNPKIQIKIIDESNAPIIGASLSTICDNKTSFIGRQTSDGFDINSSYCSVFQLKAIASEYKEKTVTWNKTDQVMTIKLEKDIQLAKVTFYSKNLIDLTSEPNVEIILTSSIGETKKIITDSYGYAKEELKVENYTYSANSRGEFISGSFTVDSITSKEIELEFKTTRKTTKIQKIINVLVVSETNNPIASAEIDLYKDKNLVSKGNRTNTLGLLSDPVQVSDSLINSSFFVVVDAIGFEKKIVRVTPIDSNLPPQKIVLKQGENKLTVITIDDNNSKIKSAFVNIKHTEFDIIINSGNTDNNGVYISRNLPKGRYEITASTTNGETGTKNISMDQNKDQSVEIKLITGTGSIRFNFYEKENRVSPSIKVYLVQNDDEKLLFNGKVVNSTYDTNKLYVGTRVKVVVEDENYFKTETHTYTINRLTQTKKIYLVNKNTLPNSNRVQLFLEDIYSSNPLSNITPASVENFLPDRKYYLYFNLLVNDSQVQSNTPIAVFFTGDYNKNLDLNSSKINAIFSVDDSQTLLDTNMKNYFIDPLSTTIAQESAKIGNTNFGTKTTPIVLPLIVELLIDKNTIKDSISYKGFFGDENSLLYKLDFVVGEKFCIKTNVCPPFLFSNYVSWNNAEKVPFEEDYKMLIGDNYKLFTSVRNTSDNSFSNVELVLTIPKEKIENATFIDDKNSVRHSLNLDPLSASVQKESLIIPKKAITVLYVTQTVEKIVGGIDELRNLNNTSTQKIKFTIKSKEELEISTSPSSIDEKSEEPFFIIKTTYKKNGSRTSAFWKAEKVLSDGTLQELTTGQTDINGIEIISFDATNLIKGDKIRFTAYDNNGSIDGNKEIIVGSGFRPVEVLPQECLSVIVDSTNVTTTKDYYFNLNLNETKLVSVVSDCNEERIVGIKTDVRVSDIQLVIPAKQTKTLTITGKPRGQLLGAYPVQILSINGSRYSQLAYFDVVLFDPNSDFSLAQAIFDFREIDEISSSVTNKKYSGRKDNFYPKMYLSTNSASLSYKKPGIPEEITFTATVLGSSIESYVVGIGESTIWEQRNRGDDCDPVAYPNAPPTELFNLEAQTAICENYIKEMSSYQNISDTDWFDEPDIPETDPTKSFYSLPKEIQDKIVSELIPVDGKTTSVYSDANLSANKEKYSKISFIAPTIGAAAVEVGTAVVATVNEVFGGEEDTPDYYNKGPRETWNFTQLPSYFDVENEDSTNGGYIGFQYYPTPLGDYLTSLANLDCQELEHFMEPLSKAGPENWTDCGVYSECFHNSHLDVSGNAVLLKLEQCNPCKITAVNALDSGVHSILYTQGSDIHHTLQPTSHKTAIMQVQPELYINANLRHERQALWEKEVTIKTTEGVVQNLGSYEGNPLPLISEIVPWEGHMPGETWVDGTLMKSFLCAQPIGFIDVREGGTNGSGETFNPGPPAHPWVEYDPSGLAVYGIPPWTIPNGVRMFLKDGQVYAEYIGNVKVGWIPGVDSMQYITTEPEIKSPVIDFNLTKVNLLGNEYAIITVQDWVSGTEKKEAVFQIKLKGNETSCYSSENEEGYTGEEYVPKVLFNWNWETLTENQCDSTTEDYIYCDGVQFNISLFKKLLAFENLFNAGKVNDLATRSSFYSYLIRDNYSENLLKDFSEYYSNSIANSPPSFYSNPGYKKFIDENKLSFRIRNQDGSFKLNSDGSYSTLLDYGGLYRVEINVEKIDSRISSMFDGNKVNAEIIITLMPIQKAPNYNPFYETPFDGEVGYNGSTRTRADYGVSVDGANIQLNNTTDQTKTNSYSGSSLLKINSTTSNNLGLLKNGVVLRYHLGERQLVFNPSRPNPVALSITNNSTGKVIVEYNLSGANNQLVNDWLMVSSTLGNANNSCLDLEENDKRKFREIALGNTRSLAWNNAKRGTITLATTVFAPKDPAQSTLMELITKENISLTGIPAATRNNIVYLTNYLTTDTYSYTDLQFVFDQIKDEKMCLSKANNDIINVWWNQEYLTELIKQITPNKRGSC